MASAVSGMPESGECGERVAGSTGGRRRAERSLGGGLSTIPRMRDEEGRPARRLLEQRFRPERAARIWSEHSGEAPATSVPPVAERRLIGRSNMSQRGTTMMGRALLMVGWVSTGGLVLTGILGYRVGEQGALGWHLLAALFSTLLLLFSHSWILFYLIGTGKAIKTAAQEHDLRGLPGCADTGVQESQQLLVDARHDGRHGDLHRRRRCRHHGPSSHGSHATLFWVTLAIQVWTLVIEGRVLGDNERLMRHVDRQVDAALPPGAAP